MKKQPKNSQTSLANSGFQNGHDVITQEDPNGTAKNYRLVIIVLVAVLIVASALFAKNLWTGWKTSSGNQYYYYKGTKAVGITEIDGKHYFFDDAGVMQTGWQTIDDNTYYFNEEGPMQIGRITIDGKVYSFDENGVMVKGWETLLGKTYYFGADGVKLTGFQTINNNTYYFDENGAMKTGIQTIDGDHYFFDGEGALRDGWLTINDQVYCAIPGDGAFVTGKATIDGDHYYFDGNGVMQIGEVKMSRTNSYYFDDSGRFQYQLDTKENPSFHLGQSYIYTTNSGEKRETRWCTLDKPLEGVLSMVGSVTVTNSTEGNPDGIWEVLVRSADGTVTTVNSVEVQNGIGSFGGIFMEPLSVEEFTCIRKEQSVFSGSISIALNLVACISYDF